MQDTVRAHALGKARQGDRFACVVRSRASHYRHAPARLLHTDADDRFVFGMAERGRFSSGSARNKPVNALLDLLFDQTAERLFIDLAVPERGQQR